MNNYLIFMDVSGEIDKKLVTEGKIHLISMTLASENETYDYTDTDDGINLEEFYNNVIKMGIQVRTTQISPSYYEELFDEYLKNNISILYLCLSSGLSSSYNSACLAAEKLKEKYPNVDLLPIDSVEATAGMSIIAEKLIYNQEKGMSLKENFEDIEVFKHKVCTMGAIDDLDTLKRGGRISPTIAFFGKLLNVKPIINIQPDGKLEMKDKKHGKNMAIRYMFEQYKEYGDKNHKLVYIAHANEPRLAEQLENKIKEEYQDVVVKIKLLSPIIGAHLGKGSVVIGFLGDKEC